MRAKTAAMKETSAAQPVNWQAAKIADRKPDLAVRFSKTARPTRWPEKSAPAWRSVAKRATLKSRWWSTVCAVYINT